MRRILLALFITLGNVGCDHASDRVKNAGDAAAYGIELDGCIRKAEEEFFDNGSTFREAEAVYLECAEAVDKKYGVKK